MVGFSSLPAKLHCFPFKERVSSSATTDAPVRFLHVHTAGHHWGWGGVKKQNNPLHLCCVMDYQKPRFSSHFTLSAEHLVNLERHTHERLMTGRWRQDLLKEEWAQCECPVFNVHHSAGTACCSLPSGSDRVFSWLDSSPSSESQLRAKVQSVGFTFPCSSSISLLGVGILCWGLLIFPESVFLGLVIYPQEPMESVFWLDWKTWIYRSFYHN